MFNELKCVLDENNIKYDESKLENAVLIAKEVYDGKTRYTGETYIEHTLGVAMDVANLKLDEESVYAALLHEVIRNGGNLDDVRKKVSAEVADIIIGVDNITCLNYSNINKLNEDTLRKMFMAIAKDIRVVIIKLIDRLYNMRRANNMEDSFRKTKAKETLEIYSPIAHRLGISSVKSELEDISFRILYPQEYQEMKKKIDAKKSEREAFIKDRIEEITSRLEAEGVVCKIYGRPKHFYSIYKKMQEKGYEIEDIFDLLAIRIIVDSIKDCYTALGIVHELYKPMPGRFKDYIAVPKTNNYQSLHTTVFGENSNAFEVQIRTWDMQRHAEYGIAAHFMYKEKNKSKSINENEQKIMWVRQTLELQKELAKNSDDFKNLKTELFCEEVFVFTPKGEIKALPKGSTVIDFAYSIHQNVAEKMTGAKINGKIMPISTVLKNTDVVQIITSSSSKGPNLDWLKYVKTSSSKNKITSYIKKKDKEINVVRGKELIDKELKKSKINKDLLLSENVLEKACKSLKCKDINNVYENVGFGSLSYVKAANKIIETYNEINNIKEDKLLNQVKSTSSKNKSNQDIIEVEGLDSCLVKFARCCLPIYGDEICGYVTCSSGVSVHRADCKNLKALDLLNRKINVKWKSEVKAKFNSSLKILANFRESISIDIIKVLQDMKIEIIGIKANKKSMQEAEIIIDFKVYGNEELNKVIRMLKKVDSVYDIIRLR